MQEKKHRFFSPSICLGTTTNRDEIVYSFGGDQLRSRVTQFINDYNAEVDRYKRSGVGMEIDQFVRYDRVKWSEALKLHLKRLKYATFSEDRVRGKFFPAVLQEILIFDPILNEKVRLFRTFFPTPEAEQRTARW